MINPMQPQPFVWVTNTTALPHADKFGGMLVEFEAGASVLLPADVATVMFGYGEQNKTRCLLRLGLMRAGDVSPSKDALDWLAAFHIEEAVYEPPSIVRGGKTAGVGQTGGASASASAKKVTQS